MTSDAVVYIFQLHIHNAKAEESTAGKKFTSKQLNNMKNVQSYPWVPK